MSIHRALFPGIAAVPAGWAQHGLLPDVTESKPPTQKGAAISMCWQTSAGWMVENWLAVATNMKRNELVLTAVLGVAIFSWAIWIPDLYAARIATPPFEQLHVSEGHLTVVRGARQWRAWDLRLSNGETLRFRCGFNARIRFRCLDISPTDSQATVRWAWIRIFPFWENRVPFHAEVGGETVIAYEEQVKRLAWQRNLAKGFPVWSVLFLMGIFLFNYKVLKIRERRIAGEERLLKQDR